MSLRLRRLMLLLALLLASKMAIGGETTGSDAPADSQAEPIDTIVVFGSAPECVDVRPQ